MSPNTHPSLQKKKQKKKRENISSRDLVGQFFTFVVPPPPCLLSTFCSNSDVVRSYYEPWLKRKKNLKGKKKKSSQLGMRMQPMLRRSVLALSPADMQRNVKLQGHHFTRAASRLSAPSQTLTCRRFPSGTHIHPPISPSCAHTLYSDVLAALLAAAILRRPVTAERKHNAVTS